MNLSSLRIVSALCVCGGLGLSVSKAAAQTDDGAPPAPSAASQPASSAQPAPAPPAAAPPTAAPVSTQPGYPWQLGAPGQPIQVQIVEPPKPWKRNRISFGPLGMLLGIGSFTYEHAISESVSFEVSPTIIYWGLGGDKLYGGGLSLGASYYLSGRAPEGLRLNASVGPGFVSVAPEGGDTSTAFLFTAKALFGYNWIWDSGFSLGLGAGVQYAHVSSGDFDGSFNGILPAVDFNLGFAF